MTFTLADAFNERKRINAQIEKWKNRLSQANSVRRHYRTETIEGKKGFQPLPGSDRTYDRHYSVQECLEQLDAFIAKDMDLALRISKTNEVASATVVDLDGNERTLTIPELLVLKNDIIPKMERIAQTKPLRADGVNIIKEDDDAITYRTITPVKKREESVKNKHKITKEVIEEYEIMEVTDYGLDRRMVWDEIDRIQKFLHSVKTAINQANKTELVEAEDTPCDDQDEGTKNKGGKKKKKGSKSVKKSKKK